MKEADVIVIGAGIAGASAAALIASKASVLLLEQEAHPGYHSTGRSAATWAPYYGPPEIQILTRLSGPTLHNPPTELSASRFTSPRGQMVVGTDKDQAAVDELRELGMQPIDMQQALDICLLYTSPSPRDS